MKNFTISTILIFLFSIQILAQNAILSVDGFTLVNAETDEDLFELTNGMQIDIDKLPTTHLDIRANTSFAPERVVLSINGPLNTVRTERVQPYALFQDLPIGDYIGADFEGGRYKVTAIPYYDLENFGRTLTVNFEFADYCNEALDRSFIETFPADCNGNGGLVILYTTLEINQNEAQFWEYDSDVRGYVRYIESGMHSVAIGNEPGCTRSVKYTIESDPNDCPDGPRLSVRSFTLVNADTDEDLFQLSEGLQIDVRNLPTRHLDIRANATEDVESVRLELSGQLTTSRTESLEPYALFRDLPIGDYIGADFPSGYFTVSATPYNANNAGGEPGNPLTIDFELADYCVEPLDRSDVFTSPANCNGEGGRVELVTSLPISTYDARFWEPINGGYVRTLPAGDYMVRVGDYPGCTRIINFTVKTDPENCREDSLAITDFILVNADNEMDLFPITSGMQIDRSKLPTTNLDIRAATTDETESVSFQLFGAQNIARGESIPPYALFQDLPIGDYIGHEFDLGGYTLSATPYSQNSSQGDAGETLTINFEFMDSTSTLAVSGFTLIDAATDEELFPIVNDMVISLADIPSLFLDIRANTTSDVESVRLELTGTQTTARTESLEPYALFRDLPIGDYIGNNFVLGSYTVTATPYSKDNLMGIVGTPLSTTFQLVHVASAKGIRIAPNQATTFAKVNFDGPAEAKKILIFDISGRLMESWEPNEVKDGASYVLDVIDYRQGVYIVKIIDSRGIAHNRQLMVKR